MTPKRVISRSSSSSVSVRPSRSKSRSSRWRRVGSASALKTTRRRRRSSTATIRDHMVTCQPTQRRATSTVLEVLASPAAGAAVDVPLVALLEPEPRPLEDLRVEVAPVVDDDHDPPSRLAARAAQACEDAGDALHVAASAARDVLPAPRRRARARAGPRGRAARRRSDAARGSRSGPDTAAR